MRNNNLTSISSYSLLKCDKSSKYRMKCVFFDCYFGHFFCAKKNSCSIKIYVFLQSEFKKCYSLQKDKYYNRNLNTIKNYEKLFLRTYWNQGM